VPGFFYAFEVCTFGVGAGLPSDKVMDKNANFEFSKNVPEKI
jgi:hypothetical protein